MNGEKLIGKRIECIFMDDPFAIPSGTQGTIEHVDSIGQIHMKWDNGRELAINPEIDSYKILD